MDAISKTEGQVVLSGSTLGGYSYDDHELKNGVFSAAVVDGLKGKATADEYGFITASGLAVYVNDRVLQWVVDHRSDQGGALKGIEARVSASAAQMPLAVDIAARNRVMSTATHKEHLIHVLQKQIDFQNITGAMVDDVSQTLNDGDQAETSELMIRLEKLDNLGASYSSDFASWWNNRELKVSVDPEYRKLQVGQSEIFTIESSKPIDESQIRWVIEPDSLAEVRELSNETTRSRLELKATEEGTIFLRILDDNDVQRAQATIAIDFVRLKKPSLRWPILSFAVAGALGAYAFMLSGDADDILTEWNQCRTDTGLPCEDLGDEYDSKTRQSQIVGIAAGVIAAGAGILTYKYFKAKKRYEHDMKRMTSNKKIQLDIGSKKIGVVCRF